MSEADLRQRELRARANLAMAELVGWIMINAWRTSKAGNIAPVVLEAAGLFKLEKEERMPMASRRISSEVSVTEESIEDLERRRGGSPPPPRDDQSKNDSSTSSPRSQRARRSRKPFGPNQSRKDRSTVDVRSRRKVDIMEDQLEGLLHSEKGEGWRIYLSVAGVLVVALVFGLIG